MTGSEGKHQTLSLATWLLKKNSSDQVSFAAVRWTGPWKVRRRTNGKETAYELNRYHEGGTQFTTANIRDLRECKGYKGGDDIAELLQYFTAVRVIMVTN